MATIGAPSYFATPLCTTSGRGFLRISNAQTGDGSGDDAMSYALTNAAGDVREGAVTYLSTTDITSLPNGTYTLVLTNGNTGEASPARTYLISCAGGSSPLALVSLAPTSATQVGGGTIAVRAAGGVAPLTATIVALGLSQALAADAMGSLVSTFLNIPAGTYQVAVTDSDSPTVQQVFGTVTVDAYTKPAVYGCTDPAADNYDPAATQDDGSCVYTPPPRFAHFEVPAMQSLRFVQPTRTDKPAFDNTLLADETPLDYSNPGYCQLVEQGDTLVLQAQSNYQGAPVLNLLPTASGATVLTVPGVRVQQGAGITASFELYAKPDTAPGFTRLYFNNDALPLPFLPGQRITVAGTGTALDGTYPIHDVLEDAAAAVPYLRLLAAYPSGAMRLDGNLTTTYVVQAFDTWQFVVPFAGIAPGCYQARITAADVDFADALAVSEPIDVAYQHRNTKLIAYRNFDNSNDLNYSAALVNRQRVVSRFFRRKPAGETTVLRNDDSELVLLEASAYRKVELEVLLVPDWLHEVLFVAFKHDFVKVDGVEVVLEGEYEITPTERYTLGKGAALLEVKRFLGAGNRDDLGDVDAGGGPFLLVNEHFLKVNI